MMSNMQKTVCALAILATTSSAAMAESVDVKVTGTITPSACTPTLSGGGTIDYGTIRPDSLAKDAYTILDEKKLNFSVTCDAPTKVAITATNGRLSTLAGSNENKSTGFGISPVDLFDHRDEVAGLGLSGSAKIGGYAMSLSNAVADGKSAEPIRRIAGSGDFGAGAGPFGKSLFRADGTVGWQVSVGDLGTTTPVAFKAMSSQLNIKAYINKASELDLTKPIKLDGLTTLELVYL